MAETERTGQGISKTPGENEAGKSQATPAAETRFTKTSDGTKTGGL